MTGNQRAGCILGVELGRVLGKRKLSSAVQSRQSGHDTAATLYCRRFSNTFLDISHSSVSAWVLSVLTRASVDESV